MDIAGWRKAKDDLFERSPQSPLTPEQRRAFRGLAYFAEDPRLRFVVRVDRDGGGIHEEVEMSDGSTQHLERVGTVRFSVEGREVSLVAYEQGEELFIPFRDATSGQETYGAGRYVEAEPLGDGAYELDFNRAYNPYCAYNESWRCPLPPRENWLAVAIRAGEQTYPHDGEGE